MATGGPAGSGVDHKPGLTGAGLLGITPAKQFYQQSLMFLPCERMTCITLEHQARHKFCFAAIGGGETMTLSRELFEVDLTFHCPGCETAVVRKGSWIKSAKVFICDACSTQTRLTYGLKLAIFDAHLHPEAAPSLPATRGQSRQ